MRRLGGLAAGAGDARLDVDHRVGDALAQRPAAPAARRSSSSRGRPRGRAPRISSRCGSVQAVDGLVEQLGRLVRLVPALVALAVEAEVGGQVDDLQAALAQRLDRGRGRPVRVGHERGVGPLGDRVRRRTPRASAARGSAGRARRGGAPRRERAVTAVSSSDGCRCTDRGGERAAVAGGADDGDAVLRHAAALRSPPAPASIAARRSATSSSVSVRSGARNSSRSASDLLPSPTCSPR